MLIISIEIIAVMLMRLKDLYPKCFVNDGNDDDNYLSSPVVSLGQRIELLLPGSVPEHQPNLGCFDHHGLDHDQSGHDHHGLLSDIGHSNSEHDDDNIEKGDDHILTSSP